MMFMVNINAIEQIDMNHKGSINITFKDPETKEPINNGSFMIVKVADVTVDNGYHFTYTEAFKYMDSSLDNLESRELVNSLIDYIQSNSITGEKIYVGEGELHYSNIDLGLYLVVNTDAFVGYETINPFLVSVPMHEDEQYIYDINANSKLSIKPIDKPTPPNPPKPPITPPEGDIPVTGQLRWPIPVMAISGLLLVTVGYIKKFKYEKN